MLLLVICDPVRIQAGITFLPVSVPVSAQLSQATQQLWNGEHRSSFPAVTESQRCAAPDCVTPVHVTAREPWAEICCWLTKLHMWGFVALSKQCCVFVLFGDQVYVSVSFFTSAHWPHSPCSSHMLHVDCNLEGNAGIIQQNTMHKKAIKSPFFLYSLFLDSHLYYMACYIMIYEHFT